MKIRATWLITALCWAEQAAAHRTGQVYLYDPHSTSRSNTPSRSISPVEARLVFAQRAGVEDYHAADLESPEVITAINDYGLRTPLFTPQARGRRATIYVEGETASISSLPSDSSFTISPAPQPTAAKWLVVDLAEQSDPDIFAGLSDTGLHSKLQKGEFMTRHEDFFYVAKSVSDFEAQFKRLVKAEYSITAIVIPPGDLVAIATVTQWGSYSMPQPRVLQKRQDSIPDVESFTAPVSFFQENSTQPLRGILPACFSTQSACETATRNCTGHGSCGKKYHDPTAGPGEGGSDCFACMCARTVSADGKTTTTWGGPACQKKDVSLEFWLLALFTVGLVSLIGFAVSALVKMGEEELPGVIGAGVSGPSARK